MKRIFLPILALISLYLYFPIFCFVKEVTVEGNKLVQKEENCHLYTSTRPRDKRGNRKPY